jgi:hypothetical protein
MTEKEINNTLNLRNSAGEATACTNASVIPVMGRGRRKDERRMMKEGGRRKEEERRRKEEEGVKEGLD